MNLKLAIFDSYDAMMFLAIGGAIGGLACAFVAGISLGDMRHKAVERNAAEWVVDQKTGETTFTWKEIEQ